jgi:SNF family Na+-dependent transporter
MAGNAVGLGNFLRFPVQAIENGGGLYNSLLNLFSRYSIIVYRMVFRRRYGGKLETTVPYILDSMVKGGCLNTLVFFGIFTNIAIASYYCYIESWTMSYVYHTLIGTFDGMSQANVAGFFDSYTDHILQLVCLMKLLFSM